MKYSKDQWAWVDGELCPADEVVVGAFDLAACNGLGVFETMLVSDGEVKSLDRHLQRMQEGLATLSVPLQKGIDWMQAISAVLEASLLEQGDVRLRITVQAKRGGDVAFLPKESRVVITALPYQKPEGDARVVTGPWQRNSTSQIAGVKCISYAESLLIYQAAQAQDADEALLCNEQGVICEGAMANVFFQIEGNWYTPSLETGCLGGIERERVLELAERKGIEISQNPTSQEKIEEIEAAFLTSSLRGVQAISEIDGRPLPKRPTEFLD